MNKIAIFGVPRSGTSWLSQIFNSHPEVVMRFQPLFSYGHKGRIDDMSSAAQINLFFQEIFNSQDPFVLLEEGTHKKGPTFEKSEHPLHIVFKETRYLHVVENILQKTADVKIIGIVRNPLSVLASWIRAPKEFKPEWSIDEEWRYATSKNQGRIEEFYGFEKWKEVALKFLRLQKDYQDRFKLITYERLRLDTQREVERIFGFCGLEMRAEVANFIADSKSRQDNDPYSVYKLKTDDEQWKEILPKNIIEAVKLEMSDTQLMQFLESK